MRTRLALVVVVSFAAATLVAPGSATAAPTAPRGRHYVDPRYADHATVAVEGRLVATEIDRFGAGPTSSTAYAVQVDAGTFVAVTLTSDLPANGRFRGELAITGRAAKALKAKGLMPAAGRTVDEDTAAGSVALGTADEAALPVAEATVTVPAAAAAPTPQAHHAYVAKLTDQGSVNGTDEAIGARVDDMLAYWTTESSGAITSFTREGDIEPFDSDADIPTGQGCGIKTPEALWNQAALLFDGVSFSQPGNHLIVLIGDECGDAGPVGMAEVGDSLASGGQSVMTFDATFKQVGAHELGHNFGLQHANLDTCSLTSCEYYDLYSPMGIVVSSNTVIFQPPALGTLYRTQLGLTDPTEVTEVLPPAGTQLQTTSYSLLPRSSASGMRGLLVTDPVTGTTYSVDLRSHTLRDAGAFYSSGSVAGLPTYPAGVVIERQETVGGKPDATYLMTHPAAGRASGGFKAGDTFEPSSLLKITVGTVTSSAASVAVTFSRPSFVGTATVGRTVTAQGGTWPAGVTPTFQWNLGGVPIAGATGSTYVPTTSGQTLTLTVTGNIPGVGNVSQTSTGALIAPGTFSTARPTIGGTAKVGRTLRAYHGTWTPTPTSWTYRWYANGSPIAAATTSTYLVSKLRVGQRITVKVTASRPEYVPESRTSATTAVVTR
ncbi:hypothetical protein ASE12_10215 [Aeromicrobium sp. Root236]|uniref:M12 family metallo-peptidase n=1 Tax=Aeromicrobium sp. Root236 TaxID=1736498 RepID=UPI0006FD8713|nr:M12 family metallo-peptidase [Aeromicrobium sp. Root236]KRC65104.1 hypothetical protein ASE12_10215 [Aeromicrobium sp. Root236]